MSLTAVVRLMVEHVGEDLAYRLALREALHTLELEFPLEVIWRQSGNEVSDALVFDNARFGKWPEVVEQNGIERLWLLTGARQSTQPYPIGHEDVIERGVKALEVRADVAAIHVVRQDACVSVKP